jgi:hypothetical protein
MDHLQPGTFRFTYVSDEPSHENDYEIAITSKIKDKTGTRLKNEKTVQFKVTGRQPEKN